MNGEPNRISLWRAAFRAHAQQATGGTDCPSAQQLWAVRHCELSLFERRSVIDHISACGACAGLWQLIPAGTVETTAAPTQTIVARSDTKVRQRTLERFAAAVLLALGITTAHHLPPQETRTIYRSVAAEQVRLLLPQDGASLPAHAFKLEWSEVAGADHYEVSLATNAMTGVYRTAGVRHTSYQVPAEVIASLPSGSELLWQVVAIGVAGERIISTTRRVVVE